MKVSVDERGRGLIGTVVTVVVVFLVAIGVWYYVQGKNGSVRAAWSSIKESSEDAATTTKVKTALMLSKHVSAFDIAVNTESYALEFAQVDTRKNKGPVKIVLHNGIPVRFRVVDSDLVLIEFREISF